MRRLVMISIIIVLLIFPTPAKADIAPPAQPPGSNLQPGTESTQVQMAAETVLIDVQASAPAKTTSPTGSNSRTRAYRNANGVERITAVAKNAHGRAARVF